MTEHEQPMPPHWNGPEDAVKQAVASAALDGREIDPQWQLVLGQVASGKLSADEAVRMAIAETQKAERCCTRCGEGRGDE